MAIQKRGTHSFQPPQAPVLTAWAAVAGKRESEGPLGAHFDQVDTDTYFGEKTWEQAECKLQQLALSHVMRKGDLQEQELELVLSGDLLNQCISSSFALRNRDIPALGLYGACSTMAQSLLLGAMAVGGGFVNNVVAMTSSHFAASERQYRFPLNYGGQRPPTAQWTTTGAGAALLRHSGPGPVIEAATIGTIHDLGVTDANQMGAAMAPAAFDTLDRHFKDLGRSPEDYDLIVTGDLGSIGKEIVTDLFRKKGVHLGDRYTDCGVLLFDPQRQDVHAGGSGCGCSAIVLCGYLLDGMKAGLWKRLLFCGTGALLSPTSVQQGRSIPGICHGVSIVMEE